MVTNSNIQVDIFGIYEDNTTRISLANVGTLTTTASTVPSVLYRYEEVVDPYFASVYTSNYYEIEGTFNLRLTTMTAPYWLYFDEPSWTVYGNRRLLIRENSTSVEGWTELWGEATGGWMRYKFPSNYHYTLSATTNKQFLFRYTTQYSTTTSSSTWSRYNGLVVGTTGAHTWVFGSYTSTWQDYTRYQFVPYATPISLTINNHYPAAGRQTVLDLSFNGDTDATSGNEVVISFGTSNLLYSMFEDDLEGDGTSDGSYRYLDCREWSSYSDISNSRLVCLLHFGNRVANPPTPANLTIQFTKSFNGYPSPNHIRILIANVKNPTTVGMNVGVTVNIDKACDTWRNQPCHHTEARGFYVTKDGSENAQATSTSFTSSDLRVLRTSLTHTFTLTLTASLTTSDAIYIIYPENFQGVMPSDCSVSGFYCYVFPTRRWVALYPTSTKSSGSLTISMTSMNNPYYSAPHSQYFLVTVARSNALGDTYKIIQPAFTPVTYNFQNTGQATGMTVSATQTTDNNMYLRNYANTVIFTISRLFSDNRAKAIYIKAPSDVTVWDSTYCNASISTTSSFNYPLRFECKVDPDTPSYLRITRDEDTDVFTTGWGALDIKVHAKFTLADFSTPPTLYVTTPVTSGNFEAYSSVNDSSSSDLYYMSQTAVNLQISQNQVPVISVINFNQKSFASREARVNNKVVFYLLFKPLANVNIGKIVFTIPTEFNYPGVFEFDNCLMIGRTQTPQTNCKQDRVNSETLVTIVPTGWDDKVKILQIGTVDDTNWFTAPSLPGDFYNLNVAVYDTSDVLFSKETRKISSVYGEELDIPSIVLKNIQDQSVKQLAVYDLQFVTGSLQIPPGATTTATTQTSEIHFIFENFDGMNPTNVFTNDLGTGLKNGEEVGCVIFSGLTALSGKRIKCLLKLGTSETDKPTIRIVNYDFVNPATTIIIGFAGLESLPHTLVNTISVAVRIYYNDINSNTYLYIPTPVATNPTQSVDKFTSMSAGAQSGWGSNWVVNMSYSGVNIVLEPTTFAISYRVPYWYWKDVTYGNNLHNYAYSSTGAADQYILMTFYPHTILDKNNPTSIACASCTSVEVFYASGTVRFRHSTSTSGNWYRTFTFTNFPTSAYERLEEQVYCFFQIIDGYEAIFEKNISLHSSYPRTVEKCTKFNFGVLSAESTNGGEIGVDYEFSIKTNHFVPSDGALSITIPEAYGDLLANQATCTLSGFTGTNCYCRIRTKSRIDIYANGTELDQNA